MCTLKVPVYLLILCKVYREQIVAVAVFICLQFQTVFLCDVHCVFCNGAVDVDHLVTADRDRAGTGSPLEIHPTLGRLNAHILTVCLIALQVLRRRSQVAADINVPITIVLLVLRVLVDRQDLGSNFRNFQSEVEALCVHIVFNQNGQRDLCIVACSLDLCFVYLEDDALALRSFCRGGADGLGSGYNSGVCLCSSGLFCCGCCSRCRSFCSLAGFSRCFCRSRSSGFCCSVSCGSYSCNCGFLSSFLGSNSSFFCRCRNGAFFCGCNCFSGYSGHSCRSGGLIRIFVEAQYDLVDGYIAELRIINHELYSFTNSLRNIIRYDDLLVCRYSQILEFRALPFFTFRQAVVPCAKRTAGVLVICLYGVVSNCLVCTHGIKFNLGVACLAVSTLVFLCLRSQFLGVLCGNCSGRLCGHSGCSSRSDRCIICVNHNRIYSEVLIGTVAPGTKLQRTIIFLLNGCVHSLGDVPGEFAGLAQGFVFLCGLCPIIRCFLCRRTEHIVVCADFLIRGNVDNDLLDNIAVGDAKVSPLPANHAFLRVSLLCILQQFAVGLADSDLFHALFLCGSRCSDSRGCSGFAGSNSSFTGSNRGFRGSFRSGFTGRCSSGDFICQLYCEAN